MTSSDEQGQEGGQERLERSTRLTLEAAGITLLGVILSISLTIGFGIKAELPVRIAAGAVTAVGLVAVVKLGSSQGALRRAANWITRAASR